ncbi:MAG: hypothetical protein VW080_09590 [Flavobacteriaceae bacterium]
MNDENLRNEFKTWSKKLEVPPLPEDHQIRFAKRLRFKSKARMIPFWRWAALLLICIGLGSGVQFFSDEPQPEVIRFQKAEINLMNHIEEQLRQFESINSSESEYILKNSKKQLERLQQDYRQLYQSWESNSTQPQLIFSLITNLKIQMELLNELHNQLNTIQKPASNESL